jgi:hypothetical protein
MEPRETSEYASNPAKYTDNNHERNRQMNCENPLK